MHFLDRGNVGVRAIRERATVSYPGQEGFRPALTLGPQNEIGINQWETRARPEGRRGMEERGWKYICVCVCACVCVCLPDERLIARSFSHVLFLYAAQRRVLRAMPTCSFSTKARNNRHRRASMRYKAFSCANGDWEWIRVKTEVGRERSDLFCENLLNASCLPKFTQI